MTNRRAWRRLLLLLGGIVATLASCANPAAPSGGPKDQTPPSIVKTRPVRDTVNVPTDTRSVYVEFSEYVERSSLPQALSVTPQFEQRLRFDWSGQGVRIELPESLRDSTTYLFSFSTNLSDAHGVALEEPITVAFATGPRINRGQIQGRVVRPNEGQPQAKVDIYAYALSDSATAPPTPLPERPAYRTQTGKKGTFTFEYLREQPYYVVALKDNNRNRRPDPAEPFAVPPRFALQADTSRTKVTVPWLLTKVDTLAPRLQRVQPRSRRRVLLSFSEPVRIGDPAPAAWTLRDSITGARVPVRAVYRSPDRADAIVLRTASMDEHRHVLPLPPPLVTDTLGQELVPDTARFQAVPRPDTTRTRFQTFLPTSQSPDTANAYPLLPDRGRDSLGRLGQQPGVRFNQAPDSTTLRSVLSLQDTTGRPRSFSLDAENDGRTYRLQGDPPLQAGAVVEVAVDLRPIAGPDTTYVRRFRRVTSRRLGALEGRAVLAGTTRTSTPDTTAARSRSGAPQSRSPADTVGALPPEAAPPDPSAAGPAPTLSRRDSLLHSGPIVVELIPTESTIPLDRRTLTTPPGSTFVFRKLPEGTFRFRAFLDRNENGRWDGGRIRSYVPAEPITWSEGTTDSRPRWTNVLPAPLRIPILRRDSLVRPAPSHPDTTAADSTSR